MDTLFWCSAFGHYITVRPIEVVVHDELWQLVGDVETICRRHLEEVRAESEYDAKQVALEAAA